MAVRWGILGAGSVAQRRVIPAMSDLDACELGALMVRDQARAEGLAAKFGIPRAVDNAGALLGDPELDAVYISSPPNLHCEQVVAAAERGKHVLCEKPMALSAEACRRMIDACRSAGVHLEVCFVLRGWPIYHRVREMLSDGRLGEIVELRAHLAKWTPREPGEWRLDPRQGGGGVLIDVGSHYIDLFRFLLGDLASVIAMTSDRVFGAGVEESAFMLFEFACGAHGTIAATSAVPYAGNVLEIFGTKGALLLGKSLRIVTEDGESEEPATFPDYYSGLLTHFCRCVASGGDALASGEDGLRNVEAIQAAYRAVAEGKAIEIGK
jgi:predicted dehydrogenase